MDCAEVCPENPYPAHAIEGIEARMARALV
jgi:succinate dehydrogenase/fumarate reductase-like Fe-S protein